MLRWEKSKKYQSIYWNTFLIILSKGLGKSTYDRKFAQATEKSGRAIRVARRGKEGADKEVQVVRMVEEAAELQEKE